MNRKLLNLVVPIVAKSSPTDDGELSIFGYANTVSKDRMGDVIVAEAWLNGGLTNYLKNPIVLAFHNHSRPIGTATEVSVDSKGLKITAKISTAADDVFKLIKDGVLKAFSVGFLVKDADYDSATDIFVIKDAELLEVSVVSVPANQDSLFELNKSFDNEADYKEFKKSFEVQETSTPQVTKGDKLMDPKELAELVKQSADSAAKAVTDAIAKADEEKARVKATADADIARRKEIIELGATGAERLVNDVSAKVDKNSEDFKKAVDDLRTEITAQLKDVASAAANKMNFSDRNSHDGGPSDLEKTNAVILSKALKVGVGETKYANALIEKYGQHVPSAYWEDQVSTNMQEEIRRSLVIAPLFTTMQMPSAILRLPLNPEAGYGTWVNVTSFGTVTSSGSAGTHVLKELTLTAYKLATKEFLQYEEEDDALVALLPIITDAMKRRMSKSIDKALLIGAGSSADPIKGITVWATAGDQVSVTKSAKATVANLASMRRKLGTWGLNPSDCTYIVSSDVYYDLLDDANFYTWDKVGPKASILTGAVGQALGSNVIISGEFAAKPTTTNTGIGAVCVNTRNYILGQYKGLRMENDTNVEYQQKLIVSTMRWAFQQLTTNEGNAAGTFLWT